MRAERLAQERRDLESIMAYNPFQNGNQMNQALVAGSAGVSTKPSQVPVEGISGPSRRAQALDPYQRQKYEQ